MSTDAHDEKCEAEFISGPMAYTDCGCSDRATDELRTAATGYEKARAAYEFAAMRGQVDDDVRSAFGAAGERYARALSADIKARRGQAPTFEQILRDPTQQLDPNSEILKSIAEYQNAPSSTVGWMRPDDH